MTRAVSGSAVTDGFRVEAAAASSGEMGPEIPLRLRAAQSLSKWGLQSLGGRVLPVNVHTSRAVPTTGQFPGSFPAASQPHRPPGPRQLSGAESQPLTRSQASSVSAL